MADISDKLEGNLWQIVQKAVNRFEDCPSRMKTSILEENGGDWAKAHDGFQLCLKNKEGIVGVSYDWTELKVKVSFSKTYDQPVLIKTVEGTSYLTHEITRDISLDGSPFKYDE